MNATGRRNTNSQLSGELPPISQTIPERHAGYCWLTKEELMNDYGFLLMDTPALADLQKLALISSVLSIGLTNEWHS